MTDYDSDSNQISYLADDLGDEQPIWIVVLRWIGVLPGAIVGASLMHVIFKIVSWLGSSHMGGDTWLDLIWREILGSGIYGAAFVWCAAWIAPCGKAVVGTVFAGLVLFLSGLLFFVAFGAEQWMSVVGVISMNVGSILTAVSIWNDGV